MKNKKIVWTTIAGTLVCVVFAVLFFGIGFNDLHKPPIYFLILGFAGSLTLALLKQKKLRDVIFINILIYFMFAIVSSFLRPITAVILLIYFTAMVLAIYFYVQRFDKRLNRTPFARPLVLAAVMGLFYIAGNVVHGLLFISHFTPRFLLANLPIGFLLGLGFGLGAELGEKISKK
ncbi:hypothetical protein JXQ31_07490 [candidate division KSB1 bacterium]|nr:hypothetical protein [candidate division KSB1 bacterium]